MKKIFSFFLAIALCMPMANGAVKVHTEPKQEGIRTTQSVTPATKILRDGRLYILRNGVEYHVTGQRK